VSWRGLLVGRGEGPGRAVAPPVARRPLVSSVVLLLGALVGSSSQGYDQTNDRVHGDGRSVAQGMAKVFIGGIPQAVGQDRGRGSAGEEPRPGSVHQRRGRLCRDEDLPEDLARSGSGSRGRQRSGASARAATAGSRRARRRCAGQAHCRVRPFDTDHDPKTTALDAHSIAIVAIRTDALRVLKVEVSSRCCACSPIDAEPSLDIGYEPCTGSRRCSLNLSPAQPRQPSQSCRKRLVAAMRCLK
jgi:hypothetical protein